MREMCSRLVDCKAVNQSKSPRVSHTRALDGDKRGWGAECCCRPRRQRGSASSGSELPPPSSSASRFTAGAFGFSPPQSAIYEVVSRLFRAGRFVRLQFSRAFLEALRHYLQELLATRIIPRQPSGDAPTHCGLLSEVFRRGRHIRPFERPDKSTLGANVRISIRHSPQSAAPDNLQGSL